MFRLTWFVRALVLTILVACTTQLRAENDGQDDLDKATQLKITAEKLDDLAEVIERLDDAIEKGLDDSNEEIAQQMLVSTLMQRGTMFAAAVFNVPPQDPQRGMRLMQLRSWALTDLQRALELDDKLVDAQLQIGKLQALPLGDNGEPSVLSRKSSSRRTQLPNKRPKPMHSQHHSDQGRETAGRPHQSRRACSEESRLLAHPRPVPVWPGKIRRSALRHRPGVNARWRSCKHARAAGHDSARAGKA